MRQVPFALGMEMTAGVLGSVRLRVGGSSQSAPGNERAQGSNCSKTYVAALMQIAASCRPPLSKTFRRPGRGINKPRHLGSLSPSYGTVGQYLGPWFRPLEPNAEEKISRKRAFSIRYLENLSLSYSVD
jgi:hypothetical protein